MAKVTFLPSGKSIDVAAGTLLFDAALRVGLPVASSCGVFRVCARCNIQVVAGAENLNAQTAYEKKLLTKEKLNEADRISCLTRVQGDCTVTTTYW